MPGANDPDELAEPLGAFVRFAIVMGRKSGKSVTLTSGRRSRAQQIELRRAHCGPTQYDIYEKPSRMCRPPTARPGESKHETGEAADLDGNKSYAATLLSPFGVTRPVAGEDWHFEYKGANPANDLQKLARTMEASGQFTEAEVIEVFGVAPGASEANVALGLLPVRLAWRGLQFVLGTGARVGNAVDDGLDTVTGAVDAAQQLLALVNRIAGYVTDPKWWRRVGQGAAGVALIGGGVVLLSGDLLKETIEGTVTDE